MKDFLKKHKILCIILLAIPVVAIGVFVPLLACGNNDIVDLGSFLGGLVAYIGTATLGMIAVWQNHKLSVLNDESQKKLNDLNRESQRNLTRAQIDHESYVEAKNSIVDAVAVFDIPRLAHSILDAKISDADIFIRELVQLQSDAYKARTKLFLNSGFADLVETEPCFTCPTSSQEHKAHVMATVLFREHYTEAFERFMTTISSVIDFFKESKEKTRKEQLRVHYEAMLANLATMAKNSENKKREKSIKDDISKLEAITTLVDIDLGQMYNKIWTLFNEASHEMVASLNTRSKTYISAYARAMKMNFAEKGRHDPCKKKQDYNAEKFAQVEKDFATRLGKDKEDNA